ncbi:MAG: hypothetical protein NVS3B14_11140 [Ktedonobacteraceae bacterium]
MSEEQELIPIEQQTILFYDQELIVVRLPDGRPGVVVGYLCRNLQIDTTAQIKRIQRTEAIVEDLVFMRIDTPGGQQRMAVLVLHAVPFWLAGIDPKRVREEIRPEILRYQREVVDVLYTWAQSPKAMTVPSSLVPTEQIIKPTSPASNADLDTWREYYRQMILWIDWQHDIEQWRGNVETRLEGLEEVTNLIPEILERLGYTNTHIRSPARGPEIRRAVARSERQTIRDHME